MTVVINGTTGITSVNGTAAAPSVTGTDTDTGIVYGTNTLSLATGGTTAVTVDSAQNVGIGVTPSVWYTGASVKALQVSASTSAYGDTNSGAFNTNWYLNTAGTEKSIKANWALRYTQDGSTGTHAWRTSNAIAAAGDTSLTMTQAMTLDASGRLGVGVTSMQGRLCILNQYGGDNYASNYTGSSSSNGQAIINAYYTSYAYSGSGVIYPRFLDIASVGQPDGTNGGGIIRFLTNPVTANASAVERARIDSNGNFLVGTESGSSAVTVSKSVSGQYAVWARNTANTNGDGGVLSVLGGNCVNTTSYHFVATIYGSLDKFYVYGNGNVVNVNNSYGTLSDVKLKENIVDATPKLDDVMRLQVRNFNLKSDPEHKQIGFIAQEFEQVFPRMIDESDEFETVLTTDEDGNEKSERVTTGEKIKSIKTSVLVPILVKAIQEQQAIITQLQADVAALKA